VLARIDARVEPREVNGQPGAILRDRDGNVVGTLTLDLLGGRIQTIRSVVNPDKLGHVGPVADAWAITREVKQLADPGTEPAHSIRPERADRGMTGRRVRGFAIDLIPEFVRTGRA